MDVRQAKRRLDLNSFSTLKAEGQFENQKISRFQRRGSGRPSEHAKLAKQTRGTSFKLNSEDETKFYSFQLRLARDSTNDTHNSKQQRLRNN